MSKTRAETIILQEFEEKPSFGLAYRILRLQEERKKAGINYFDDLPAYFRPIIDEQFRAIDDNTFHYEPLPADFPWFEIVNQAISGIANNEVSLELLKILMGPEPVKKQVVGKLKTSYEEKLDDSTFQLMLAALNVVSNFNERLFTKKVIEKYKKYVDENSNQAIPEKNKQYIKEKSIINEVEKCFIRLDEEKAQDKKSWIVISYDSFGKREYKAEHFYTSEVSKPIVGARATSATQGIMPLVIYDYNAKELLTFFANKVKLSQDNDIVLTSSEFNELENTLTRTFADVTVSIATQYANDLEEKLQIENVGLNGNNDKLRDYFLKNMNEKIKDFFGSLTWIEFKYKKKMKALIRSLETETENLSKACIRIYQSPAILSPDYEQAGLEVDAKAEFETRALQWLSDNTAQIPEVFSAKAPEHITRDIIESRKRHLSFAFLKEVGTRDTPLHKAVVLYNDQNIDGARKERLRAVIELLFMHGANAFERNLKGEMAYDFIQIVKPSMSDWSIAILQLKNSVVNSHYSQLLLNCLYQYSENNNHMFNESKWYYLRGFWMDQEIKIERLRSVWSILHRVESFKHLVDDKALLIEIGKLIHGDNWKRKHSSQLLSLLIDLEDQGLGDKILMLDSSIDVSHKESEKELRNENEHLKTQIRINDEVNAKKLDEKDKARKEESAKQREEYIKLLAESRSEQANENAKLMAKMLVEVDEKIRKALGNNPNQKETQPYTNKLFRSGLRSKSEN